MSSLQLRLLGGFSAEIDATPLIKFRSARSRGLLAWLAAQPDQMHPRTTLATLFWGNYPDSKAKGYLRTELSALKRLLNSHPALEITRAGVTLHSLHADIDSVMLMTVLDGLSDSAETTTIARALNNYQGEFLAGFSLDDAPEFVDWKLLTQERLHWAVMNGYDWLQQRYLEQGAWPKLVETAQQQLGLVPWHEPAYRSLIQGLAAQGYPQEARAQFDRCAAVLAEEFGGKPSAATRDLLSRVLAPAAPKQHNLPPQLTKLVGRSDDIAQAAAAVREHRLVTLLGMGGIGKTRLSLAVGDAVRTEFADGIWFVPLVAIASSEQVAAAIMAVLDLAPAGAKAPIAQLTAVLRDKQMLLILDNVEQLSDDAADFLLPLLTETSAHLLLTSRNRTHVAGERPIALRGLPQAEAIALFHLRSDAPISDRDAEHVADICRLVEGLPLGIELAAHWTQHFTPAEIAAEIAASKQFLQNEKPQERHGSLRAVFDYSWQLLSPQEQVVLAQCSVFRGGFQRDAALTVTQATLTDLTGLINKSLLRRIEAGRYELHEVVREFSAEKAPTIPACQTLHQQHAIYFSEQLIQQRQAFLTSNARSEFAPALRDLPNVQSAWWWSLQHNAATLISNMAVPLFLVYRLHGRLVEGATLFDRAIALSTNASPEQFAQLQAYGAFFHRFCANYDQAGKLAEAALSVFQRLLDSAESTEPDSALEELLELSATLVSDIAGQQGDFEKALYWRGVLLERLDDSEESLRAARNYSNYASDLEQTGQYANALKYGQKAIDLLRKLDDPRLLAISLNNVGTYARQLGRFGEARAAIDESLALRQAEGNPYRIASGHRSLGYLALSEQHYAQAEAQFTEALRLYREAGATAGVIQAQHGLGKTALAANGWQAAIPYLANSLEAAANGGATASMLVAIVSLSECLLAKGDQDIALGLLQGAANHPQARQATRAKAAALLTASGVPLAQDYAFNAELASISSNLLAHVANYR